MSVRGPRVEVITRGERRRRWPVEQKREIAVYRPSQARRYGISGGLLCTWRWHLLEGTLSAVAQPIAKFARVEVKAVPAQPTPVLPESECPASAAIPVGRPDGMIEMCCPAAWVRG